MARSLAPGLGVDSTEKTCRTCGDTKPLADFCLRATSRGGRSRQCKKCKATCSRNQYRKNPAASKAARQKWNTKPESKTLMKEWHRKNLIELRTQVLQAYGGMCACCGESNYCFLAIDHINGGGRVHKRELGGSNQSIYRFLIKNSFPSGYRVLCHNCNQARGAYGFCPHERIDSPFNFAVKRNNNA